MIAVRPITSATCARFLIELAAREAPETTYSFERATAVVDSFVKLGFFAPESDEPIGVFGCQPDGRLHIAVVPAWQHRWNTRATVRAGLEIFFLHRDVLFAAIPLANARSRRLAELVGFVQTATDETGAHYRLARADRRF